MAGVLVEGVSRYFGSVAALDQVGFALEPGSVTAVCGPNGAGKSTLLQCLAGVQLADEGRVIVGGYDLSSSKEYRNCKRSIGIGYLPQQPLLYTDLSIQENLLLFSGLHGDADPVEVAERAAAQFGLTSFLERRIAHCSQGVVRRAGAARAMLGDPKLLLLDEPFAHLDTDAAEQLQEQLLARKKAGATIVLVSHYPRVVEQLAESVLYFRLGRLFESSGSGGGQGSHQGGGG